MTASARNWNPGPALAESVLDAIESAASVQNRHQFFVWMQAYVGALVPHEVAVCGAYNPTRKCVPFEVFSSIVLTPEVSGMLAGGASVVVNALSQAWVAQGCVAQSISVAQVPGRLTTDLANPSTRQPTIQSSSHGSTAASLGASPMFRPLREAGLTRLLVHGVSRPQHPGRLETLFVLLASETPHHAQASHMFGLLMPHLHTTYRRVQLSELQRATARVPSPLAKKAAAAREQLPLTSRELEILGLVRQGMSNRDIGESLAISALTVKNHAQNIFRKLGVNNRTQAVARAISRHWLSEHEPQRTFTGP